MNTSPLQPLDLLLSVSFSDANSSEGGRKLSFNGELNGLLGAGLLGSTTMSESTRPISTDLSCAQESQIM